MIQILRLEKERSEERLAIAREYVSRQEVQEMEALFAAAVEGLSKRLKDMEMSKGWTSKNVRISELSISMTTPSRPVCPWPLWHWNETIFERGLSVSNETSCTARRSADLGSGLGLASGYASLDHLSSSTVH